jgi:GNAT superfamily N-acetyltransferase
MLALRHRDDPKPTLTHASGLESRHSNDAALLARLLGKPLEAVKARFADGHRAYVARLHGTPAAFGWVATRFATIGELGLTLRLPAAHGYLWNFVTLPEFRGRGIYPRLLQSIVDAESASEWLWIMHAPENRASGIGIAKAGFLPVAEVAFDANERIGIRELRPGAEAIVARLLGAQPAAGALTPCWKCVRAGRGAMACVGGDCHCDYQRPHIECHVA